jgi:hypothetical protein
MEELKAACLNEKDGMKRLVACLVIIRKNLRLLKEYLDGHPIAGPSEEIEFFKYIKPKFYQWLIYYQEKYTLESRKPMENGKALPRYFEEQLKFYDRFFRQNEFHYQYYKLDTKELDNLYFIRGAEVQEILIPEVPDVDPVYGTSMDYLFSKFMAYESLQKELLSNLNKRKQGQALSGTTIDVRGNLQRRFQWTGETVNLIEVAHGIYLNGQVNEGELGINEFFEGLGEFFGVNLGVPKSGFDDLKARKRLSKTHFTDRMRAALLKKMEDEDAYDPHKVNNRK